MRKIQTKNAIILVNMAKPILLLVRSSHSKYRTKREDIYLQLELKTREQSYKSIAHCPEGQPSI